MNIYKRLVYLGRKSGCHRIPERSFHIKGKQFPVCARCTGVLIGNIAAAALFLVYALPLPFCLAGCAVMFTDWLIQRLGIRESTNIRRLITGMIGGYTLTTLYCLTIQYAIQFISNL